MSMASRMCPLRWMFFQSVIDVGGNFMVKIDDSSVKTLEQLLGRGISQEEGSCRDYAEVYDRHVEDVRELVRKRLDVYANKYVIYLLGEKGSLSNSMTFVYHVVKKGMDLNYWMEKVYGGN